MENLTTEAKEFLTEMQKTESNLNLKNLSKLEDSSKKFDLNDHLINFLNKLNFGSDKDSKKEKYCLSCKAFFEAECLEEHTSHEVVDHSKDLKNTQFITQLFDKLESKFFNEFKTDLDIYDSLLSSQIQKSIEKLLDVLNSFKVAKVQDMENLKHNQKINFQVLKKNFFELKFKFSQFYKKNDIFLNLSSTPYTSNNANISNINNCSINNNNSTANASTANICKSGAQNLINVSSNNNNLNTTNVNNLNNTKLNALNTSGFNSLNKSLSRLNKPAKASVSGSKLMNEVFYLINLDLNRQIEATESKLELFLEQEKTKLKFQADEVDKLINKFINTIENVKEEKKITKLDDSGIEASLANTYKFPDFTHNLHLRLSKYSEIFDKLNFTLMDLKNPNSYKKIEGLIGNMENDVIYKLSQKAVGKLSDTDMLNFPDFGCETEIKNNGDTILCPNYLDDERALTYANCATDSNHPTSPRKKAIDFTKITIQENKLKLEDCKFPLLPPYPLSVKNKDNAYNSFKQGVSLNNNYKNYINFSNNLLAYNNNNKNNTNNFKSKSDGKDNCLLRGKSLKETLSSGNSEFELNAGANKPIATRANLNQSDAINCSSYNSSNNLNININSSLNQTTKSLSYWKSKEDLIRKYLILSLMGTYDDIQELEEEHENLQINNANNSKYEKILKDSNYLNNIQDPILAKVIETTNEILIYDKKSFSIIKHKVNLNKDLHGIEFFLDGCRTILANDKIYITGGRDISQQYSTCLEYDYKFNLIKKIENMKNQRAYHSLIFNSNLMKIFAVGGERNKTCEEYDLFRASWKSLPELNFPRAYINCFVNKSSSLLYAFFGLKGEITKDNFTEAIEVLNLDNKAQGWVKIEYSNKSDINLKSKYVQVFPIEPEKLLIVGNAFTRYNSKNFAIYDLKIDNISKIDSRIILEIKRRSKTDPEL